MFASRSSSRILMGSWDTSSGHLVYLMHGLCGLMGFGPGEGVAQLVWQSPPPPLLDPSDSFREAIQTEGPP